jgi:GTPase SAR1 family protein
MATYKIKCLIMGDPHIDTWGLLENYLQSSFNKKYKNTIGCDIGLVDVQLPYETVSLSIWDIACSDRYRFFRSTFFKGASCAIVAFDLTRYSTFNPTLISLITELYSTLGSIPIILLGCNADKPDYREIPRDLVDQLCERMAHVLYFELASNNGVSVIPTIFETAAELFLKKLGYSEEDRRKAYEWRQEQLRRIKETIIELGFPVNDRGIVEILTRHGLFSVNISNSQVLFEPLICSQCKNHKCYHKKQHRQKYLCIVSDSEGWSNIELADSDLLLLAKILAIAENRLPNHVLNQMRDVTLCAEYIGPFEALEFIIPEELPDITFIGGEIHPAEARTLLRNHQIQFNEGRLPYSLYCILKQRYEAILNHE